MLDILVSFYHAIVELCSNIDWELAGRVVSFSRRLIIECIRVRRALIADRSDKAEKPDKNEKDA